MPLNACLAPMHDITLAISSPPSSFANTQQRNREILATCQRNILHVSKPQHYPHHPHQFDGVLLFFKFLTSCFFSFPILFCSAPKVPNQVKAPQLPNFLPLQHF